MQILGISNYIPIETDYLQTIYDDSKVVSHYSPVCYWAKCWRFLEEIRIQNSIAHHTDCQTHQQLIHEDTTKTGIQSEWLEDKE